MSSLRTPLMRERYHDYLGTIKNDKCALCEKEAIQTFNFWKLTANKFPYDLIAQTHHMLIPLRHVTEEALTADELREYAELKKSVLQENYEWLIEASAKKKSIPGHFHLHLIVGTPS